MSVAVSCNLSDGVILGVDSAVTLPGVIADRVSIIKVYENAAKLFQLGDKPIGIAIFGMGAFGNRTLGSYIREFEVINPDEVVTKKCELSEVAESLRSFFMDKYKETVVPAFEQQMQQKIESIPLENRPGFGLVVGGFSSGAYLSEVWAIDIPQHDQPQSAECQREQGQFGTNWFASAEPIVRYFKGYDPVLMNNVLTHISSLTEKAFSQEELEGILSIMDQHEYQVPYMAMPIEEGIAQTRFLVEMVINHHKFSIGAPIVGGKANLGMVTYKGGKFQLLDAHEGGFRYETRNTK